MAWAIFSAECNWSRPKSKFSFNAKPKAEPQSFPHDFVDYAVSIGRATKVKPPRRRQIPKEGA
ncbi:hypothetical protein CWR43_28150 [Rhizobium sullae]|uniref:Uncharacterized protein n=1 Tax=Rhizobium sullae TaxID=50338 RepID=A0A2N0D3G1_RHISU|nr:hypothetical protein CWR43_28150 [Rhizobium sullae]